jgi:hypothetical protein
MFPQERCRGGLGEHLCQNIGSGCRAAPRRLRVNDSALDDCL